MKKTVLFLLILGSTTASQAQAPLFETPAKDEIAANRYLAGSNYLDYDRQLSTKALTPAPKGYEPFYMSHYGRHGSRWLIVDGDYTRPLGTLRSAKEAGKLTPLGEETLKKLEDFYPTSDKRLGDLTTVGERQHHGIGKRMVQNFPEIFKARDLKIDARSTVVTRCILSMIAECEELMATNPTARIHNDVSDALQYYLNQDREGQVKENAGKGDRAHHEFSRRHTHPERLVGTLFNDPQWAADSIDQHRLMHQLFEVAINMQSHDDAPDLIHLFNTDEIYDMWRIQNAGWYQNYAASPLTGGIMQFSQANLLDNIIQTADTCVALRKTQATLRFGHEVCVMPLACLLELDSCGASISDLEQLDQHWRNYRIFPMACNIQLIFYRPQKGDGDILVKALLNEREVSLPVSTTQYPYYRWTDLRNYYTQKLRQFRGQ